MKNKEMDRALKLRSELYDLANKFAIEGKGEVAVHLHEACNCILKADNVLNGRPATNIIEDLNELANRVAMLRLGL